MEGRRGEGRGGGGGDGEGRTAAAAAAEAAIGLVWLVVWCLGGWVEDGWLAGWLERVGEVRWVCVEMSGGSLGVCWEGEWPKQSLCCWCWVAGIERGRCWLESLLFVLVSVARRVSGEERRERGRLYGAGREVAWLVCERSGAGMEVPGVNVFGLR